MLGQRNPPIGLPEADLAATEEIDIKSGGDSGGNDT